MYIINNMQFDPNLQRDDQQIQRDYDQQTQKRKPPKQPTTTKSLQNQLQYFGNKIEPFNMTEQQDIGNVDEQGFFVFNRGKQKRDAWLDSVREGDDQEAVDQMVKKIKQTGRFKSVYQGDRYNRRKQAVQQQQQDQEEESYQGGGIKQAQQSQQKDENDNFKIEQLVQLIISQIPAKTNANNYMKTLKKNKKMDDYDKLLTISNLYIEKTGEYDILTKKKEDLQQMLQQILQKKREKKMMMKPVQQQNDKQGDDQIANWDDEDDEYSEQQRKLQEKKAEQEKQKLKHKEVSQGDQSQSENKSDDNDDDNIF